MRISAHLYLQGGRAALRISMLPKGEPIKNLKANQFVVQYHVRAGENASR
jgi:hypothetical protein